MNRFLFALILLIPGAAVNGQPANGNGEYAGSAEGTALVERSLANELRSLQDRSHPMRYQLRKSSPRYISTKEIYETGDGAVARLVAVNDKPLNSMDAQKELDRLNSLMADPGKQRRRKQGQDNDTGRALKVLRVMPRAFVYQFAGTGEGPMGRVEKFSFRPNPGFTPPDLETQVLTAMTGQIWIDPAHQRVVRLEGRVDHDVDFGWGILGRLYKGGWLTIDQTEVGGGQWRTVRFQMAMSVRVLFRTKVFETTEEQTHYAPLSAGLSYQRAIAMMREDPR